MSSISQQSSTEDFTPEMADAIYEEGAHSGAGTGVYWVIFVGIALFFGLTTVGVDTLLSLVVAVVVCVVLAGIIMSRARKSAQTRLQLQAVRETGVLTCDMLRKPRRSRFRLNGKELTARGRHYEPLAETVGSTGKQVEVLYVPTSATSATILSVVDMDGRLVFGHPQHSSQPIESRGNGAAAA